MKLSFCTTCMGRRDHLEVTLPANLAAIAGTDSEIVVIDYNSPDGMSDWLRIEYREPMLAGVLRCFQTREPRRFNMAHAKNMAHNQGVGDVLVNLDADNILLPGYVRWLLEAHGQGDVVTRFKGGKVWGCYGRISVSREAYIAANGYNEWMIGWGYEDGDFLERVKRHGAQERNPPLGYAKALQHGDHRRTQFMPIKNRRHSHERNRRISALLAADVSWSGPGVRVGHAGDLVEITP